MFKILLLCLVYFSLPAWIQAVKPSYGRQGCRGSSQPRLDPTSCQSYFQCINGVQYRARCSPGMVFSKSTRKCELSAKIPCTADRKTGHPLEGSKCSVNGEIRPSEIDCEKYLLCRVRTYVGMTCPFGLIFSNIKYRCVLAPDQCLTEAELRANATMKELEKQEESPYIGICDGKLNATLADPFDCSMYIHCEEDSSESGNTVAAMSILECPKSTLFSDKERKCMPPKSVYCGSRYRVVALYGNDAEPLMGRGLGRGIGRAVSDASGNQKAKQSRPKYWVQPGRYRAISKFSTNNRTNTTFPNQNVPQIITASVNGLLIQKPIKYEVPTPIATTEQGPIGTEEPTPSTFSSANGRSFSNSSFKKQADSRTILIPRNFENGKGGVMTGHGEIEDFGHHSHDPIIIKIIMGEQGKASADCSNEKNLPVEKRGTNSKSNAVGRTVEPKLVISNSHGLSESKELEPDSLASDEYEPFKFSSSGTGTRGPKRKDLLEDYIANLNGKILNSTAEDILYYGDSEYYVSSSENETGAEAEMTRKMDRLESSLELSHHSSGHASVKRLPGTNKD